jgi:DNA-binding MarR family transcriptional regulator
MSPRVAAEPAAVPPLGAEASRIAARASHMMGPDAERAWPAEQAIAWEGLMETSRQLRRGAEEVLIEGCELGISMQGILGRLSRAPKSTLRQTELADAMGLSLSRVSRVVDLLEKRSLVQRRNCPSDARATNVTLTRQGAALTARAQRELFAFVQGAFFDRLEPAEVQALAAVFTRLIDLPPEQ